MNPILAQKLRHITAVSLKLDKLAPEIIILPSSLEMGVPSRTLPCPLIDKSHCIDVRAF
jgi:hypothetical protein